MAKVRLADIAKVAGVSAVPVHNAITGQKGVSDEMRARILEIAKEMGYRQPGSGARNTQGKSLRCIGVVIPERYLAEYTTFYWKMYQEMALGATEKSCMVTVEILKQEMEDEMIVPCIAKEQTVDALILMGDTSRDYIHYLKKNVDLPIVFLDFYDNELAYRRMLGYPPCKAMLRVMISAEKKEEGEEILQKMAEWISQRYAGKVSVLGPSAGGLRKRKDRFHWQLMIKGAETEMLLGIKEEITAWMENRQHSCYVQYELDG